jgi:phage terminase large subunit-like protein
VSALMELRYAYATEADYFSEWCADNLRHSVDQFAGEPVVWEPWQRDFFEEALAANEDGSNYWSTVGLVVSRKNGKTAMLAALALYRLLEDDGQPEILLAAASDKQAGRLFDAVVSYLRQNPELNDRVHRREYMGEIVNIETGGKIIRLPSSGETLDGYNPSLAICDELHAWTTPTRRRVWASLNTGGAARTRTQVVTITTAGDAASRADSILGRMIDGNETASDTDKSRDGLTISRNHDAATLLFNYCAPTSDPADVDAMKLANPASWVTTEFLARQAANSELTDSEVLQLHGCVWAESFDAWIKPEWWDACRVNDAKIPAGANVVVGVDVGLIHDATAVVVAWMNPKGKILLESKVWAPGGSIGDVMVDRVNLSDIEQHIRDLAARFKVREVVYDKRYFERSAEILAEDRLVLAELEQNSGAMASAYQDFYQAVLECELVHAGGAVLTAHVLATGAEQTDRGWKIRKLHQSQRIDALVAAAMAHYRCRVTKSVEPQWAFA